ncbi:MAG: RNA ligase family protein [Puniceicoccales bacterium]|jgi:ATP-dependent RNA circularization protein (DNA/RNA ligase family)|nr:RNA ligase family protein [Puniceicoccales bacterium]
MSDDFFKFPHTPHLAWIGKGTPREDKILSKHEAEDFLSHDIHIEEKVDGANIGISFDKNGQLRVQNRGGYLIKPYQGQFEKLPEWLSFYRYALTETIGDDLILFGEWMAAVHSIEYPKLPDLYIGFDVFQKSTQTFWSKERRDGLLRSIGLPPIQSVAHGRFTVGELIENLSTTESHYRDGAPEGFYFRVEENDMLKTRAKLVRSEFIQAIDVHWAKQGIRWNPDPRKQGK